MRPPARFKHRVMTRFDNAQHEALKAESVRTGVAEAEIVRNAVELWLAATPPLDEGKSE